MPEEQEPHFSRQADDRHQRGKAVSHPDQSADDRLTFRALMANLPSDYRAARDRLTELSDRFHDELAVAFQPHLQAELASMPIDTLEDKRALAIWANGEVRHLGLAFRAPSGIPARLVADWAKNHKQEGRFRFDISYQKGGSGNRREGAYYDLPPIELTEEGPRKEALSKWTDRVAGDDTERQR